MAHDIDWINSTSPTVNYSHTAIAEYEAGEGNGIDKYTLVFEAEFSLTGGKDVGGIIIYSNDVVYDYENFCGWVR